MEQAVVDALAQNGPWAALFIWALIEGRKMINRIMDESKIREERLLNALDDLGEKYGGICTRLEVIETEILK